MSDPFELQIAKFVEKAKGNCDLVVRKVALEMFKRVIQKSPVDTGRFKSNWQAAIGSIPGGTITPEVDKKGYYNFGPAVAAVNAKALQAKAGDVIYLVNNVHYARRLEYGWSMQAPNGMVRLSISEWNTAVSKAASEVPK